MVPFSIERIEKAGLSRFFYLWVGSKGVKKTSYPRRNSKLTTASFRMASLTETHFAILL